MEDGTIWFLCPHAGCSHTIRIPISSKPFHERAPRNAHEHSNGIGVVKVWQASGQFPDTLTLSPSIDIIEADAKGNKIRTLCWHGHIQNGQIT